MSLLKWSARIHKWVALIVGVQILLWVAGGFVMSVIPIEQVRGEHKIAAAPPFEIDGRGVLALSGLRSQEPLSNVKTAELGRLLQMPVWRLTTTDNQRLMFNARSGEQLNPISKALAREIAIADYAGNGEFSEISELSGPPSEYGRPGPVWQVRFNDSDATTLYIDPAFGEVKARRSSTWRFYDFFWKLHVMDYDDGADFNHPLLITAAGAALFVAFSGLSLLIIKVRRTLLAWRRRRAERIEG